jgi:hypothetical protein
MLFVFERRGYTNTAAVYAGGSGKTQKKVQVSPWCIGAGFLFRIRIG